MGKDYSVQQMALGHLNILLQRNNVGPLLHHGICRINSEWMMDFNTGAKMRKQLEGDLGVNLCGFRLGKAILDVIPKRR